MSFLAGITYALTTSDQMERARRLSKALAGLVPHRALTVLVGGCERSPIASTGEHGLADRITARDFAHLKNRTGAAQAWQGDAEVAGASRPVVVVAGPADPPTLLLLVRPDATPVSAEQLDAVAEAWSLFTVATQQSFDVATTGDLSASRAAAGERVRVTTELADGHRVTLAGILGALRANHLDDHAARQTAIDLAASALVELRAAADQERDLGDERLAETFARLRDDLRPVTRFSTAELEFVAPSAGQARDVAVPATVGHAARAISRAAVLALLEQPEVSRLRVEWAVASGLEISVRDDGPGAGECSVTDDALAERARALGGTVDVERVPGWGTRLLARLPVGDATGTDTAASDPLATLRPRELEVLAGLADGRRNREIATKLSISENTVKFHVANVLSKLGVSSRNQAALVARDAGMVPDPTLRAV